MYWTNTFVHAPHRQVGVIGTLYLLITDIPNALLVMASSRAEPVKRLVAMLDVESIFQSFLRRKVVRQWYTYDSVDFGDRDQCKGIIICPRARLSLKMHHHRVEHLIVVKGAALAIEGEEVASLT